METIQINYFRIKIGENIASSLSNISSNCELRQVDHFGGFLYLVRLENSLPLSLDKMSLTLKN